MANAKVTLNGVTLIDLTSDTVTANDLLYGKVAHGSDGSSITGTLSTVTHPNPSVSINTTTGIITASHTQSSGLVTGGTTSSTLALSTVSGQTINPTESVQTAVASQKYTLGAVKIGAISSDYVGSNITQRSASDLSISGPTVSVPNGYYATSTSTSIPISFTPGWVYGATGTVGIALNTTLGMVTASYSHSSTGTIAMSSGYYTSGPQYTLNIEGSNNYYLPTIGAATIAPTESEQVAASAGKYTLGVIKVGAISSDYIGSNITQRSAADLSASGSKIIVPSGYYAAAASKNVGAGSATTPSTTISASPVMGINFEAGTITALVNYNKSITPTVTPGYVQSGTAGTVTAYGSNTMQLPTIGATTYTPTTTDQTIASGKYLTGIQTIAGDSNLIASNIVDGVTIFGVTGTYSAGPSRIAVQETLVYFRGAAVNAQTLNTFGSVTGTTLIL